MPKPTLKSIVRHPHIITCERHGLALDCEAYADAQVNRMSQSEFLTVISDGLDELLSLPNTHLPD